MDAISKSNTKKIIYIFILLIIIELFGSVLGILNVLYYDYSTQSFTGIFKSNLLRFILRETFIYLNAAIGYYALSRILNNKQMAKVFLLTTIVLDGMFIASGLVRQYALDNLSILTAYSNIYNIIGTGLLFLFFAVLSLTKK